MERENKNQGLEILRAVAVIAVLYSHFLGQKSFGSWGAHKPNYSFGYGVDLFLCISGYVVSLSLLRSFKTRDWTHETGVTKSKFLLAFMTRRFFRLAPSAYLWASIMLLYSACLPSYERFLPPSYLIKEIYGVVLYIYNIFVHFDILLRSDTPKYLGYYWTLSLEWQFYLAVVLMFLYCRFATRIFCLIVILTSFAVFPNTKMFVWFRLDALLWGCLIAHLLQRFLGHIAIWTETKGFALNLLKIIVGNALFAYAFHLLLVARYDSPRYLLPLLGCFSAISILLAACGLKPGIAPLTDRLFLWIGERSYSIYLIHLPVFYWINETYFRMLENSVITENNMDYLGPIFASLAILLIWGLSHLNFRFIEQPLRKIGISLAAKILPLQREPETHCN